MAASFTFDTPKSRSVFFSGSEKIRRGTGNVGTYVTNGVPITPAMFQLRTIDHLDISPAVAAADRVFTWDKANSKILCFTALGTESAQVDQSAKTFRFQVQGK